jgi:hypothetical protein
MSRRLRPFVSALAVLAATGAVLRAQFPGGPPEFPPPGAQGLRGIAQVVEHVSPRITGNSFVQVWRPEDIGGGAGCSGVVQHPNTGFVYVGNSQGVLEFDGARWRLLPLPHAGAVQAVTVDAAGRVWAVSENEIVRFAPDGSGTLRAETVMYPLPAGEDGKMEQAEATPGGVWFRGLQHIVRIEAGDRVATWRTGERFGPMWWMDGAMHTKVSERELVRLEPGGGLKPLLSREALRVPRNRPSPLRVFAARPAGPGEWILLTPLGPVRWRSGPGTWRPLALRPPLFRDAEAIAATFLPDGAMAFATQRPGGVVVTPGGRVERLLDRLPAVVNPRVTHLAADADGGLWVVSSDHVARLQLRSAFARHEGLQGLQGGPRQLLRHRDDLFVAHTGGVSRHVPWPGAFPPAEGLHRGADALTVAGDRVFAAASGLVELGPDGPGTRTWSNLAITTVAGLARHPDALLGGDAGGVWWFRKTGGEWRPAGRLAHLEAGVTALHEHGDGWVWGATADGRLWCADFRDGPRLDAPVRFYGAAEGVPPAGGGRGGRVRFFTLGDSLVATCGAWLLRHDAAADRFGPETRIPGIDTPDRLGAEAVGANADGTRWLRLAAPDRRFLRVQPDGSGRFRSEELPAPMLRDLAAVHLLEDAGTLWVAGKELLVSVDLGWKPPEPPPLRVTVRRVTKPGGAAVSPAELAELGAQNASLRFEFAAAAFVADHRGRPTVRYRTQLAGLERTWTPWSAEAWRDFTRLPAGRYTFRVQATDQAGRTSPETAVALVVRAPWWLTRGAWAGYAAGAGLLLLGAVRLRTRALRRRAAQLEAVVAARTDELRRSNAELARLHRLELDEKAAARLAEEEARLEVLRYQLNPHFLYNALNSVYSLVLTAPPAAANMVLKLADFCRVALDRRREEHTTVGVEFDKMTTYLEIEKARWGDSLHIEVEADAEVRRLDLPPFLILPLVENAIKYGGATSPETLHVRVSARRESDGALVITVANTGNWVERKPVPADGSSGIGLANLRQRLQRYHPRNHEVSIATQGGWVTVKLRIADPIRRPPAAA